MLAVMDRLPEIIASIGSKENLNGGEINSLMSDMGSAMGKITGSDYMADATEEASSHVHLRSTILEGQLPVLV